MKKVVTLLSRPSLPALFLLAGLLALSVLAGPAMAQSSGNRQALLDKYYPDMKSLLAVTASDSIAEDRVIVTWPRSTVGSVFYRVRRDGDLLTVAASSDSSYIDYAGTPGVVHTYCVALINFVTRDTLDIGCDDGSRVLTPPSGVAASDGQFADRVSVTWIDLSIVEAGFRVYRDGTLIGTTALNTDNFQDTTAVEGTPYTYCVRTVDANGNLSGGRCDAGQRGFIPPPASVTATDGQFATHVVINWSPPLGLAGQPKSYRVYRNGIQIVSVGPNIVTFADSAVAFGTEYDYCVRAERTDGQLSIPTCDRGGRGTLLAPLNVQATDDQFDSKVDVTWTDPGSTEDGFLVFRRGPADTADVLIGTLPSNSAIFSDTQSQPGVTYQYCVQAFSSNGGQSVRVCDNGRRAVILAPTEVTATVNKFEDRVEISWKSTSSSVVLFNIFRDGVPLKTVSGQDRITADFTAVPGTNHNYCVSAVTALEAESGQGCATGSRKLMPPGSVAASDNTFENRVLVSWTDLSQAEAGYRIFRTPSTGGPTITLGTVAANRTAWLDSTGVPAVLYDYAVAAFDNLGESERRSDPGSRSLKAPTLVRAADGLSELQVDVNWVDNSRVETGYRLYRRTVGQTDSTLLATLPASTQSYSDAAAGFGVHYIYSVLVFDALGTSTSAADEGYTQILPPASVNASDTYTDKVVVTWIDRSVIETGYRVQRNGATVATLPAGSTQYTDNSATTGVTNNYCVATLAGAIASTDVCDAGIRVAPASVTLQTTALTSEMAASGLVANDKFGSNMAISGDFALVGAPGRAGAGAVFAFKWNGSGWDQTGKLTPAGFGGAAENFYTVAMDGKYAIIGAQFDNGGAVNSGAAYFFELNTFTGEWTQRTRVTPTAPEASGGFGYSVDISGDVAVVGEPFRGAAPIQNGRVSTYQRQSDGTWTALGEILPIVPNVSFGSSLAISGDRLVVGSFTGNEAWFFDRTGFPWAFVQALSPPAGSFFGSGIAVDGDYAIIMSRGALDSGYANFYSYNSGTWQPIQSLAASDGTKVGFTVALDGTNALVGGRGNVNGFPNNEPGVALLFSRDATTGLWSESQKFTYAPAGLAFNAMAPVALHKGHLALGAPLANGNRGQAFFGEVIAPVADVTATDGTLNDRVSVRWKDKSNNEDGFRVYRDGVLIETVPANVRSYTDNGGEPGRTYRYSVASYSDIFGQTGPVGDFGWKPPDGNITGRVSSRTGSGVGGAQICLDPNPNNALLFDGSGGYVTLEGFTPPDAFTVEFWVNPSSVTGTRTFLSRSDGAGIVPKFSIGATGGVPFVIVDGSSTSFGGDALTANAWNHLSVVVSQSGASAVVKLYKDGVQISTSANMSSIGSLTGARDWVLGMNWSGNAPANIFSGRIDELRFWDGDRSTATDFAASHAMPLNGDEFGLLDYWSLSEGAGTVVTDFAAGNHYGRFNGGVFWTGDGAPIQVCATTDTEGNYVLKRVRYGTDTTFRVTPSLAGRQFEPAFKSITLNGRNPVQNEVAFIDITSYTVSGTVKFADTPYSTNCLAANVEILVDGVFFGATDNEGKFAVAVQPGVHTIQPRFKDHSFSPAATTLTVIGDIGGQNFTDITTRTLSGRVGGGCNFNVGTFLLEIRSEDQCLVIDNPGISADSTWSVTLPPQKYSVSVKDVDTHGAVYPSRAEILIFFENVGPQSIDLSGGNGVLDFIYRAPIGLSIVGFPDPPVCPNNEIILPSGLGTIPAVPVVDQGENVQLTILAYEDYGDAGTCPLDSAVVTIFDEIIDEGDQPKVLDLRNGFARYTTAANTPNIFPGRVGSDGTNRSFQKPITAVIDVPGRPAVLVTEWVLVTGHKPRTATFTSVTQGIPLMILRDPPGDGSSASLEKGLETCTTISNIGLESVAGGIETKIKAGLRFSKGLPFWSTETSFAFETENKFLIGIEATQNNTAKICSKTTEKYSTSDGDVIVGGDADTFLGTALNLTFAKTDVIDFANCAVSRTEEIAMGGDGFETTYLYTAAHIKGTIIPQLEELRRLQPADSVFYKSSIQNWQDHLALNDSLKTAARLDGKDFRNRSFSAGADYEFSASNDTTRSFTWSVKAFTSNELALGFVFNESGTGASNRFLVNVNFSYTREEAADSTISRTVGYTLKDDDFGDFFTVDVKDDKAFGTPVFQTISGRSSCPWEVNTQPRDSTIIAVEPPIAQDVPPGEAAVFTLSLTNASPSQELRECLLLPVQTSNPGGALIDVNSSLFGDGLSFFIGPDQTQDVTMTVSRGPTRYRYNDLKLMFLPPCAWDEFKNGATLQLADTVTFSVHYSADCSDIRLYDPKSGWVFNAADALARNNRVRMTLMDFDLAISETDSILSIGAEYRRKNTEQWILIQEVQRAQILTDPQGNPVPNEIQWNVTLVPDDAYELRTFTRCTAGRTFSTVASGRIDRRPPRPFGAPAPADSILSLGEEIALQFDELIRCSTVNPDSIVLEIVNPDNTTAPVTIDLACDGRTIKLLPQSPTLDALEGQTLRARVRGVRDEAENRMQSLTGTSEQTWTFTVMRNLFAWKQSSISVTAPYRKPGIIEAILVNGTPGDLAFSFRNLPSWLVPLAPNGTITTGQSLSVGFAINPDTLAIGTYQAALEAIIGPAASPTQVARLNVKLTVSCVPPVWQPVAGNFEQSMALVARVSINGVFSSDPNDRIAAFVGNQLRGVGQPQLINGVWMALVTIYGNRSSGETVRFQVYDASDCRLYTSTNRTFRFEADRLYGSNVAPEVIDALDVPAANTQSIDVAQGWTWLSLNLLSTLDMGVNTVLGNLNAAPGDLLKSQTTFAQFDPNLGWAGSLTEFNNIWGYQVKLAEAGTVLHEGQPAPVSTPIPVATGWNWIGYLPQGPALTNTALAGLTPSHGDIVKSQFQFTQYIKQSGTTGWFGNLTTMRPGLGYKLFMTNASSTQGSFRYPFVAPAAPVMFPDYQVVVGAGSADTGAPGHDAASPTPGNPLTEVLAEQLAALTDQGPGWSVDPRKFQYNMTLTARLMLPEGQVPSETDVVAAMVDGQVRGLGRPQYLSAETGWLVFLMMYSDAPAGEAVSFQIYDADEARAWVMKESMTFEADRVTGTIMQPLELHVTGEPGSIGSRPRILSLSQNYPNPPQAMTTIQFELPQAGTASLKLYDVAGRVVRTMVEGDQKAGLHMVLLDTQDLANGLYFYKLETPGKNLVRKMMVAR